jgi:hypothetical protein
MEDTIRKSTHACVNSKYETEDANCEDTEDIETHDGNREQCETGEAE